jgi:hypothetical protein
VTTQGVTVPWPWGIGGGGLVIGTFLRPRRHTLRPHQALDERTPRAAYLAVDTASSVWPLADPLLDREVLT